MIWPAPAPRPASSLTDGDPVMGSGACHGVMTVAMATTTTLGWSGPAAGQQ